MEDLQGGLLALEHYYEIDTRVGHDALGARYDATQKPLTRAVTVWTLERLIEMGAPASLLERLKRATWRASQLAHPSNLKILDYGQLEGQIPFIVTERTEGPTLQTRIQRDGRLSPAQTLVVLEQLQSALEEAYGHLLFHGALDSGCVHLDVDAHGREIVKLSGYGAGLGRGDLFMLDQAMFTTNLVRHLPPEAFDAPAEMPFEHLPPLDDEEEEDTVRELISTDVYGLAAIAYESLTGMHPYFRDDRGAADGVLAMLRETPPGLAEHFGIDDAIDDVVMRGLSRDPDARPETLAAFVSAFRDALPEDPHAVVEAPNETFKRPNPLFGWLIALGELTPHRFREWLRRPSGRRMMTAALIVCNLIFVIALLQVQQPEAAKKEVHFTPPAAPGEGVDLVFMPLDDDVVLHAVSPTGETAPMGKAPFILRNQEIGARLRFVVMGMGDVPTQLELLVRDPGDQVMFIDTARWLRSSTLHSMAQ